MIQAVVFDMDGVLFDTERLCLNLWKQVCAKMGLTDVTKYSAEYMGLNSVQSRKCFFDHFGADFPYDEFMAECRKTEFEEIERSGVPVKPGLYEILEYLKQNHYLVAAATSTRRATVLKHFENAKITGYFDQIICGDMVEHSKPDPEIYLKAASALGLAPQDCMAVEDSPNGITSASRAGMKTVMVPDLVQPTPELRELFDACVPSLNDLITLLEQEKKNA
jgi:haloacid dehalogenase superfamily, subfamily IA, variant 3 with third motif having DD or ED